MEAKVVVKGHIARKVDQLLRAAHHHHRSASPRKAVCDAVQVGPACVWVGKDEKNARMSRRGRKKKSGRRDTWHASRDAPMRMHCEMNSRSCSAEAGSRRDGKKKTAKK